MKRAIIVPVTVLFFIFSVSANGDKESIQNHTNHSFIYDNYFDPGHKQKKNGKLGKDRSQLEVYLGLQPSFALKLNFHGQQPGTVTEKAYMMFGMDFDSDIYAKFGFLLNPGKINKNRSLSNPSFGWWRLWRYVMVRQAIEIGYKGQFLDSEEDDFLNKNYGGFTANYTLIFDGNFIFDKTAWYFLDHRTARRIRFKLDAGLFLNLNKFNQPSIGILSGSNDSNGEDYNDDIVNDLGQSLMMPTYPTISPFVQLSVGFAIF